jgi:SAM-dependent methyltransferase
MAKYDAEWVQKRYAEIGDEEWHRLTRSPEAEVQLHVHVHYLRAHVEPSSRVLEIGAGPGRFTQILAEMGCRILIADISQAQLDLNKRYGEEYGFASSVEDWIQLDICDLSNLDAESFDTVLCYGGPLSYVFDQAGDALLECKRVLKPGGTILCSVMSIWGAARGALDRVLDIPPEQNRRIVDTGDLTPDSLPESEHFAHMYRASELRDLFTQAGLEVLALSASNCLSTGWNEHLARIREDDIKWNELLRLETEASAETGCLNMGTHIIAVARKPIG